MKVDIMLVEDDADIRDVMREYLEHRDYTVVSADHGAMAMELLEKGTIPKLILLDLMMPVMDGKEFLTAKRDSRPDIKAVPVMLLTAAGSVIALEPGDAVGFVSKPVAIKTFEELLKHHVRGVSASA